MINRKDAIKYFTKFLKDDEILLLKSKDSYFKNHYKGSPLNILTGFEGTAGEAVIDSKGEVTIFVDPRYHILVEKQAFKDIKIVKVPLGISLYQSIEKTYKKNTKLFVSSDIDLADYLRLDKHFDLRKYDLTKKYLKNYDFNKKAKLFTPDTTIEKNDFNFKIKKLSPLKHKADKLLIFNLDEISYFTNLRSFQSNFSSNFRSILYIDFINNKNVLFLDYPKKIDKEYFKNQHLEFMELDEFKNFIQSIDTKILINPSDITLENFLAIKQPEEIKSRIIPLISSIKPKSVIEHLKNANLKLDIALYNFKKQLKEGLSEAELAELFEEELIKAGAKCPSFKTIMALGENSASIHYSSYDKNKILKQENILLLDCGGYYEAGLATDITRTFYFGVNPKPVYKKIYTNVLKAFIACFLSSMKNAKEIDKLARTILEPFETSGFNFNHGLGHGIGTSVHQNPPVLSILSKDIIRPYQTHSIEPGLYGKDSKGTEFGVRIENCVYTDLNYQRHSLSNYPFEEILIDYDILDKKEKDFIEKWNSKWQTIQNTLK